MKILLTGATGFIGTNFVLRLYKKYKIVALVRKTSNVENIKKYCNIYYYDNTLDSIEAIFKKEKIEGVVHLASMVPSTTDVISDVQKLLQINILYGCYLLEMVVKFQTSFFINAATFGSYCNSLEYKPSTLYASTKKAFEDIMYYYALSNPKIIMTNLLIFNVYGKFDNSNRLFNLLRKNHLKGEELLMGSGKQIVDYSHVYDVVDGFDCLINLIKKEPEFCKNKIFSLKGKERKSLKEVVELYEKVLEKKLNIKWGARPKRELEIMLPWEGGEELSNWKQKISLLEGFKMLND